ncbi:uncharacterized protein LOC117169718 [Belonocnema kinseyi]|uniref:uncharacterized protein LOC117169718 n=1 Tax=Belonocnema kinseyi TaxID=2817044 RepID=UPI00143CE3D1|nr:uncharacterized protein LOC117169718 [Belonocnema kinseyi]
MHSWSLNLREVLSHYLKESISDGLVFQFPWSGKDGAKEFENTKMASFLYAATKETIPGQSLITREIFKRHMTEFIRAAKARHRTAAKGLAGGRTGDGDRENLYEFEEINYGEELVEEEPEGVNSEEEEEIAEEAGQET